ncbi:hypothetical protein Y032_0287g1435 [Ancylostoma ceylanicum]|uniref:Uncharacterized protein n=1 Tax=Ancylostoma ceylanicum TaxID=53326 RepID=A0A016S5P0_9BILA|nr:hypothetical protein Y032_0287g1435 [Ancylostoma ceylanicum]
MLTARLGAENGFIQIVTLAWNFTGERQAKLSSSTSPITYYHLTFAPPPPREVLNFHENSYPYYEKVLQSQQGYIRAINCKLLDSQQTAVF